MWVLVCLYYLFYKLYVWELLMTLVAVSHISLFYSLGVSCSCNCLILWRKTDEVSCAPTLAVLFQRDITVFMGNSPVSITWPETSIQAQQCRYIPTGNRGIVWVVSVLLSYTKSWYLLELVPVGLFWRVLRCKGRRSRQVCDTGQLHMRDPQQQPRFLSGTEKIRSALGVCCPSHAACLFSGEAVPSFQGETCI